MIETHLFYAFMLQQANFDPVRPPLLKKTSKFKITPFILTQFTD